MEIYPNVHHIPRVTANPYLLIDPSGATLIDAGLPGSDKKILRYISGLGLKPEDLKRIIITHADFDHIGGLAALKKASGAQIYASPTEAAAIASGRASRAMYSTNALLKLVFWLMAHFGRTAMVKAIVLLSEGQVLPILGGLQVLETSGHTPGHISLYSPSAGILFSGDSIVSDQGRLVSSRKTFTWNREKAEESTRRQAGLGVTIVCPGHGPVVRDVSEKFPLI